MAGLAGVFDAVLGGDEVANPKPAPDIYATACERLGASPAQAVALEDSPTGVAAAIAAGMYVIGVPSLPGVVLRAPHGLVAQRAERAPGARAARRPAWPVLTRRRSTARQGARAGLAPDNAAVAPSPM